MKGKIMSKVIKEFHIKNYTALILDEIPKKSYHNFLIRNKLYKPVPVYDAKNCIAIESNESFIGETVDFI